MAEDSDDDEGEAEQTPAAAPPPPAPVPFQQFGRKQRPNQRQRRRRWEHSQGLCNSSCCGRLSGIPEDANEDADMPPELQESDEEAEEPNAAVADGEDDGDGAVTAACNWAHIISYHIISGHHIISRARSVESGRAVSDGTSLQQQYELSR